VPAVAAPRARAAARAVAAARAPGHRAEVESLDLVVFVPGLDRGRPQPPRLAWMAVAGDGGRVRERIFVDAASGKPLDSWSLVADGLERRTFTGLDQAPLDGIPDSWPDAPDWVEGDPFPSGVVERDAALEATTDLRELFAALGRDGYDGAGHRFDLSWNRASFCPNASWNGLLASFCSGFATHDVVAHEWTHAYTDATAGLIYRWQSGALDESLSDFWGELVDQSRRLGSAPDTDAPDVARVEGVCSDFSPAALRLVSPPAVAGSLAVGQAAFGAPAGSMPAREIVAVVDAGGDDARDGCEPLVDGGALAGRIAYARRGPCGFDSQARRVGEAGAVALVVGNRATDPGAPPAMGCDPIAACDPAIGLVAVSLGAADAAALEAALASGPVRGAVERPAATGAAASVRWLLGEDVRPSGPARDMWSPGCFGDPPRADDARYHCSTSDSGGVHTNSGVPNRALALLVDGGAALGVQVAALGRVATAHLVWRVGNGFLAPYSDFADFAAGLGAACADLAGSVLADPWGGPPQLLDPSACGAVDAALEATGLTAEPPCAFEPVLAKDPPPLCATGHAWAAARFTFEGGKEGWTALRRAVAEPSTFDARDWELRADLPGGRTGTAFFAPDPKAGSCVTGTQGDDDSGVLVLESPDLLLPPGGGRRLAFDHYVSTEADWDGGNLKLSVDGGAWNLVPAAAFVYNAYAGPLLSFEEFNSDPLAGEPAFHGSDEGSNAGSWGRSIVDLAALVPAGRTFRLRFELGSDVCYGTDLGWLVDDVELAVCTAAPALFLDGFDRGDAGRWSAVAP